MGGEIKTQRSDFARIMIRPFETWGWKFNDAQADMLYPMVAEFPEETIERATKLLLRESKFKPRPAEIIAACTKCLPNHSPTGEFAKVLALRDAEMAVKVMRYTDRFMAQDSLAMEAKAEGWDPELENFVSRTADSMLQIINAKPDAKGKYPGFGWSSNAVPNEYQQAYIALLRQSAFQLRQTKQVDVFMAMPDMAPSYWKAEAIKRGPREETEFDIDAQAMLARVQEHFRLKPQREAA